MADTVLAFSLLRFLQDFYTTKEVKLLMFYYQKTDFP